MSIIRIAGSALVVLLMGSNPVWAIYKWTDENNVTHYDQFPPRNKKAQEIKIEKQKTPNSLGETAPARQSPGQNQSSEGAVEKVTAGGHSDTPNENCAKARQNLQILRNNKRIRIQDNGNYRILSEKERQQQMNGLKDRINATCQDGPKQQQK